MISFCTLFLLFKGAELTLEPQRLCPDVRYLQSIPTALPIASILTSNLNMLTGRQTSCAATASLPASGALLCIVLCAWRLNMLSILRLLTK